MKSKMLGLLAAGLLTVPVAAQAVGVVVGDKEWRQLAETTGFSWNQIADVCDSTTGVCDGSIGAVDFTGWTWASATDVQALFDALIQPGTDNFSYFGLFSAFREVDSIWIATAVNETFDPSYMGGSSNGIWGWTLTTFEFLWNTVAHTPYMNDCTLPGCQDSAELGRTWNTADTNAGLGVWLFRGVAVPEPTAGWMLILGLLALVATRRSGLAT